MSTTTATGEIQRRVAAGERDFQGATLSGVNLRGANLRGANLRGANLKGANLHGADLREAKLVRTDLGMADVGLADFSGADLNGADFRGANLKGANFSSATLDAANLRGADLHGADLRASKLVRADLSRADLRLADLSKADLRGADLRGADMAGANLRGSNLHNATLQSADMKSVDLGGANLSGTNLTDTRLEGASFAEAMVGGTVFADLDLRAVKGLDNLKHTSPSTVGSDTLARSFGLLPEVFLRGCGFALWEILGSKQYDPSLSTAQALDLQQMALQARAHARLPRKRILISYSQADEPFVERMRTLLLDREIFSWVSAHEMKGALRERHSRLAIQHDVSLVLVLSEASVQSDWVEHEIRLAQKLESSLHEDVLCPITLDAAWLASPWKPRLLDRLSEDRVLSFAGWQNEDVMEHQFDALVTHIAPFHSGNAAKP